MKVWHNVKKLILHNERARSNFSKHLLNTRLAVREGLIID